MFCFDCGAADQIPHGYCKRCGAWLADPQLKRRMATGDPLGRINAMATFSSISVFCAVFTAIILASTYFGSPDAKWSVFVAFAMCMVIAVHQTINFFLMMEFRQKLKHRREAGNDTFAEIKDARTAALGPGTTEFVRPASVTENTTELLEPVPRTRQSR